MPEKLNFITPTTMKVLEFFFLNNTEEFHEREVVRRVEISKGSGNKILNKLWELDFLERNRKGRMVFYKLNMKNPVVMQFKILSNIYSLKNFLDDIRFNCKKVILFGSCSNGTDTKESDIDVFILTDEKSKMKRIVNNFNKESERKMSPIIMNSNELVELKRKDEPLYERIFKGIVLWERE